MFSESFLKGLNFKGILTKINEENNTLSCRYGGQLEGLALSGMGHVTDTLWNAYLPKLVNAKILVSWLCHEKWK